MKKIFELALYFFQSRIEDHEITILKPLIYVIKLLMCLVLF